RNRAEQVVAAVEELKRDAVRRRSRPPEAAEGRHRLRKRDRRRVVAVDDADPERFGVQVVDEGSVAREGGRAIQNRDRRELEAKRKLLEALVECAGEW